MNIGDIVKVVGNSDYDLTHYFDFGTVGTITEGEDEDGVFLVQENDIYGVSQYVHGKDLEEVVA